MRGEMSELASAMASGAILVRIKALDSASGRSARGRRPLGHSGAKPSGDRIIQECHRVVPGVGVSRLGRAGN